MFLLQDLVLKLLPLFPSWPSHQKKKKIISVKAAVFLVRSFLFTFEIVGTTGPAGHSVVLLALLTHLCEAKTQKMRNKTEKICGKTPQV